jgi:SOS-response transcriptional repressor LexA
MDDALLVVDRSVKPKNGSIAVIAYNNEFLCREVRMKNRAISFTNGKNDIESGEVEIFGIVRKVINNYDYAL